MTPDGKTVRGYYFMTLELLRALYLQKFGRQLELSPDAEIISQFEIEREKAYETYSIRYEIRQDHTRQRDEQYQHCLESLRLHPNEKLHLWQIKDSSEALSLFTDIAVQELIGVIFPPVKFILKPGEGLSAFQTLSNWNLLPLIEYLQSKTIDPQSLIDETGGEIEFTEDRGINVNNVHNCIISSMNLSLKSNKLSSLIIDGRFDLTVASLIKIYGDFRKVYVPYDDADGYVFNEDRLKGNYSLSVLIFRNDGYEREDEMVVHQIRLYFPELILSE